MVVLLPYELRACAYVGKHRHAYAIERSLDPGLGPTAYAGENADNHIRGAECEYACSIMLNMYWRFHIGDTKQVDVGGLVEVRSGDMPHHRLIVKPEDNDVSPFALVLRLGGKYFFKGWLFAHEAKANYPLDGRYGDPAYYAPQGDLRDLSSLKKWVCDANPA
jgi:hypothetical protein